MGDEEVPLHQCRVPVQPTILSQLHVHVLLSLEATLHKLHLILSLPAPIQDGRDKGAQRQSRCLLQICLKFPTSCALFLTVFLVLPRQKDQSMLVRSTLLWTARTGSVATLEFHQSHSTFQKR